MSKGSKLMQKVCAEAQARGCPIVEAVDADVTMVNSGSIWVCTIHSQTAREWVAAHAEVPDWAWMGTDRFAGDWRPMRALTLGMHEAGLKLEYQGPRIPGMEGLGAST